MHAELQSKSCKSIPDKFAIPIHMFARSDGIPKLLNTVEEK